MRTYKMKVTETVLHTVNVRAKTLHEAKKYVSEMYKGKKIRIIGALYESNEEDDNNA